MPLSSVIAIGVEIAEVPAGDLLEGGGDVELV